MLVAYAHGMPGYKHALKVKFVVKPDGSDLAASCENQSRPAVAQGGFLRFSVSVLEFNNALTFICLASGRVPAVLHISFAAAVFPSSVAHSGFC